MDLIAKARELGRAIQADETYKKMATASEACDNSNELQKLIKEFNDLRSEINMEVMSDDKDTNKIAEMDAKLRELYNTVMEYPEMAAYNEAKAEFNAILKFVNQIIGESAAGADPDLIEEQAGCSGSCGSCGGGCH